MSRTFLLTIVALLAAGFAACSGAGSGDANSNSALDDATYAAGFTDANAALFEGTRLLDTGETERAIILLNRAVELNPDLGEAYFKLGIAYSLIETRDAAIVKGEITPTPLPGDPAPKPKKTNSDIAFAKAVAAYKEQVEANPQDHAAFYNLGRSYNKLNEDRDAEKAFRQAVKINPEDTEYQTDLGAILVKLAEYRDAIGPLNKAIELDPENSRAIDLLDEAEAGRRRVDFTPPSNKSNSNTNANTDANSVSEGNSNSAAKPSPPANKPDSTPKPAPTSKPHGN